MKGALECMRISGFMYGVNNPELTKRLNEHVSKTMEEMMIAATAFIRGEAAAAGKKKGHASWRVQDQSKRHTSERSSRTEGPLVIEAESDSPHVCGRRFLNGSALRALLQPASTGNQEPNGPGNDIFPSRRGIVTIYSIILILAECATVITSSKEIPKEAGVCHENFKVALHLNFPDQEVAIGGTLSGKGRTELCSLLMENLDIFAWHPSDMTGVPRSIAEHRLNIREGLFPVRQRQGARPPEHAKPSKTGTKT
ncbi:hypothetical protein Tco_1245568 [Tanacetum coccineum]